MTPPPPGDTGPEQVARGTIDAGLVEAGWVVQRRDEMNLAAGRGEAVCEFKLAPGARLRRLPPLRGEEHTSRGQAARLRGKTPMGGPPGSNDQDATGRRPAGEREPS